MGLHAGLQLSFQEFYRRSGRADLVDQVPETESQDAAYLRWQARMGDGEDAERAQSRYRAALALEDRTYRHRALFTLAEALVGLPVAAAIGLLLFAGLVAIYLAQGRVPLPEREGEEGLIILGSVLAGGVLIVLSAAALRVIPRPQNVVRTYRAVLADYPDCANAACRVAYVWQRERPTGTLRWRAKRIGRERSLAAALEASTIDPEFDLAYFCAGLVLKELGRADEAETAYRTTIRLRPAFAAARDNLGLILVDKKDFEGAVEQFCLLLSDFPDARNGRQNLSLARRRFTRDGHTPEEFDGMAAIAVRAAPPSQDRQVARLRRRAQESRTPAQMARRLGLDPAWLTGLLAARLGVRVSRGAGRGHTYTDGDLRAFDGATKDRLFDAAVEEVGVGPFLAKARGTQADWWETTGGEVALSIASLAGLDITYAAKDREPIPVWQSRLVWLGFAFALVTAMLVVPPLLWRDSYFGWREGKQPSPAVASTLGLVLLGLLGFAIWVSVATSLGMADVAIAVGFVLIALVLWLASRSTQARPLSPGV